MQALHHYFPGGNTPEGFFSYYREITDSRKSGKLAVIKGGPGTGKSTFLKSLGKTLCEQGETVTYLHCSSDPDSLDGIFLPDYNSAVIDGTSPHITDATYPGAYDMVLNFCDFIGDISEKETIRSESRLATSTFMEGYCYLRSAKALQQLMHQRSEKALLEDEIRSFSLDIAKRIATFPANGFRKNVFLSAITGKGLVNFLKENLSGYHVISVESEVGDATHRLMEMVQNACSLRNADMILCRCPMNPQKTEHLIFPSANLALITSHQYHSCTDADEIVSFSDMITKRTSNRFARLLYDELLQLAIQTFETAAIHHNRLEAVYRTVTDYSAIESFQQKTLDFLIS